MEQITFILKLRRPAVLATYAGNPNLVESEGIIPGSAILGAAAAAYLKQAGASVPTGLAHQDRLFLDFFINGKLRFLPAYPVGNDGRRLLPAPLSLLSLKSEPDRVYDLSDKEAFTTAQTEHLRLLPLSGYVSFSDSSANVHTPNSAIRYHNARPNRLMGRATEEEGAIFVYESLSAGQEFAGRILGERQDLQDFLAKTGWDHRDVTLTIGRSATAEYGGDASLCLSAPESFTREPEEAPALQALQAGHLVVTLLSPLIGRDSGGRPAAVFPLDELSQRLEGSGVKPVKIERSYVKQGVIGGYVRIWNLPRQQRPALLAGSVFVIDTEGVPLPNFRLAQVERYSLGAHSEEGFGRFVIDWHTPLQISVRADKEYDSAPRPANPAPPALAAIFQESRQRLLLNGARAKGMEDGEKANHKAVSASQLGRLIHTLRGANGSSNLKLLLSELRNSAEQQLKQVTVSGANLLQRLREPETIHARLGDLAPAFKLDVLGLNEQEKESERRLQREVERVYLLSLCTQMAWRKRQPDPQPRGESQDEQ